MLHHLVRGEGPKTTVLLHGFLGQGRNLLRLATGWAARDPAAHASLIAFTAWSSAVHGGIMAVQGLVDPLDRANLLGDVPALWIVAAVLIALRPRPAGA